MQTTNTEGNPTNTEGNIDALSQSLREFGRTLLITLADDKPLDENRVDGWLDHFTSALSPIFLRLVTGTVLPILRRARLTMEDLFGEWSPPTINSYELQDAVEKLTKANAELPLNDDEQRLLDQLQYAQSISGYGTALAAEGYCDDFLNDQLQTGSMPDWLNDYIDWEDLFNRIVDNADSCTIGEQTYYALPEN